MIGRIVLCVYYYTHPYMRSILVSRFQRDRMAKALRV